MMMAFRLQTCTHSGSHSFIHRQHLANIFSRHRPIYNRLRHTSRQTHRMESTPGTQSAPLQTRARHVRPSAGEPTSPSPASTTPSRTSSSSPASSSPSASSRRSGIATSSLLSLSPSSPSPSSPAPTTSSTKSSTPPSTASTPSSATAPPPAVSSTSLCRLRPVAAHDDRRRRHRLHLHLAGMFALTSRWSSGSWAASTTFLPSAPKTSLTSTSSPNRSTTLSACCSAGTPSRCSCRPFRCSSPTG